MEILKELQKYSDSTRKAVVSGDISLTYQQLWEKSEILSHQIKYRADRPKTCPDMIQMAWVDTS